MSQTYYTLLTTTGAAEWANAQAFGETISITHMVLGDGNGNPVLPVEGMSALTHEVYRALISSLSVDSENPGWLVVEAIIPASVGGWTIREVGLIGGSGTGGKLLAIGNFPETYKPLLAEGAAKDLVIRMIFEVSNASIVNLTINPSVAVATTQSVANAVFAHEAKLDPHPQYLTQLRGDARYRLKTDVIAATDIWFSTNISPTLPTDGGMRLYNLTGSNTVTIDAAQGTPNKCAVAIASLGGFTTVEAANGVQLAWPTTGLSTALNYCNLTDNRLPQGLWAGGVSYGRRTSLGYQSSYSAALAKGAIVMGEVTCLVCATASGLLLQAYNPSTKTLGTAVIVSSFNDESYQTAQRFSLYALDASRFIVIGSVNAVVVSLSGMTITVGAVESHGTAGNPLYGASCQLAVGTYLLAGLDGSSNTIARVLTVSGTTVTAGAVTSGATGGGSGTVGRLIALSSTSALFCLTQTGIIALSINGTAVTMGASYTAFSGQNEVRLLDAISASTALIYGHNTSSNMAYSVAVASVAGVAITIGTPVSITETPRTLAIQPMRSIPYPDNTGTDSPGSIKIDASTWVICASKLRAVTVSGTTITVGNAANSAATTTYMSKLPDGTLVVSDNVIYGVKPFTVLGTTITLGSLMFSGLTSNLVGHSINDFAGYKNIGGTYYSYPLIGGSYSTNNPALFSIPGNASVFQGDVTSYYLRDKYI